MDDLEFVLRVAVVVAVESLLPGRLEVLDAGLGVEMTRQDVEQVGLLPAQLSEPVLVTQGVVELVGGGQSLHLLHPQVVLVGLAGPHVVQPVEDDAGVEALQAPRTAELTLRVLREVGGQELPVVGRHVQAHSHQLV